MSQITEIIKREAAGCIEAARLQGYEGDAEEYELTALDCDWIANAVRAAEGRPPTSVEWAEAGHPHIGGKHYRDE